MIPSDSAVLCCLCVGVGVGGLSRSGLLANYLFPCSGRPGRDRVELWPVERRGEQH